MHGLMHELGIVQFHKISILSTPKEGIVITWGWGLFLEQKIKEMYEA